MPRTFAIVVAASFTLVALVFFGYDYMVQRRNKELATSAARSNKLVSSLFPGAIKQKVLEQQDEPDRFSRTLSTTGGLSPLAQLYRETTILFMDLVGFTAWSDSRTPDEVFKLLETLYSAFDAIGNKKRVFKVETM